MRWPTAIGAFGLALTMLPMAKAIAQTAGRVVMAVGDVAVERANERVKLAQGAEVRVGDRVTTGTQSHAQLRFSDEALVALRPDSEFHIDGYSFQSPASGPERAVFRLVKGGFRTVTGQIGRINRDHYQVLTSQATIGIRGTHYELLTCAPDQCRRSNGTAAPAGVHGAVFDGRLSVTAFGAQVEFGAREYFLVPDNNVPQRVLTPPEFMLTRVDSSAPTTQLASLTLPKVPEPPLLASATPSETPYQSTEDRDRPPLPPPAPPQPPAPPPPPSAPPPPPPPPPPPVFAGTIGLLVDPTTSFGDSPATTATLNQAGAVIAINDPNVRATLGTATLADVGSDALAGNLNWGRWAGVGSSIQTGPVGDPTDRSGQPLHYIYGNAATNLPTSGRVNYNPVGGTSPTMSMNGQTGTLVSGGQVSIDFGQATASLIGLQVGFANAVYSMSGTASLIAGRFGTNQPTASCFGNGCLAIQGAGFDGFLIGNTGTGVGLGYSFDVSSSLANFIRGVVGYRRQ